MIKGLPRTPRVHENSIFKIWCMHITAESASSLYIVPLLSPGTITGLYIYIGTKVYKLQFLMFNFNNLQCIL